MIRITFARAVEAVRRAWVERGEVISPISEVHVRPSDLSPEIRAEYSDHISLVQQHRRTDGILSFAEPIAYPPFPRFIGGEAYQEIAPVVASEGNPSPEEAIEMVADWVRRRAQVRERIRQAEAQERRQREEEEARRQEAIRQERLRQAAERAAYEAERAEWIRAHGSPRLKRLLEEGIGLDRTYREERLAAERPGFQWEWDLCGEIVGIRDASDADLAALDEARQVAPDAKLAWRRITTRSHVCDKDEGGDPTCGSEPGPVIMAEFLGERIVRVL